MRRILWSHHCSPVSAGRPDVHTCERSRSSHDSVFQRISSSANNAIASYPVPVLCVRPFARPLLRVYTMRSAHEVTRRVNTQLLTRLFRTCSRVNNDKRHERFNGVSEYTVATSSCNFCQSSYGVKRSKAKVKCRLFSLLAKPKRLGKWPEVWRHTAHASQTLCTLQPSQQNYKEKITRPIQYTLLGRLASSSFTTNCWISS